MKKLIFIFVACSFLMSCTSNLQEEPIVHCFNSHSELANKLLNNTK